jgi:peptidoglycan/LPS O-acetylase OafA/YrhL
MGGGGTGARLRHEPVLDGLRGLGVAAVVAFHLGHLRGGFLGVDLFFVLSGYLITSLLVQERARHGTTKLGAFWARRAKRLLPALFLLLAGVGVLIAVLAPAADRGRLRGDGLSSLFYVNNWVRVGRTTSYWDMFRDPSPLDHMWSLAIEEQFYLVWPLVFLGVCALVARRVRSTDRTAFRALSLICLAGTGLSFAILAALYHPGSTNRAYFGTDARVGAILLGGLLALAGAAWQWSPPRRPAWAVNAAALVAMAVLGASVVFVDGLAPWYYRGGLLAFAVATVVVIATTTGGRGGLVAGGLSWAPLRGLGLISYGVYLWHWPVIVYLTPRRTSLHGVTLDAVRVGVTLAVALASYHLVEQPIRAGALRGRPARLATLGAIALVAVLLVRTTVPGDAGPVGLGPLADPTTPITVAPVPARLDDGAFRVLVVGDSGPVFLQPGLASVARRQGAAVVSQGEQGCSVLLPEYRSQLLDGQVLHTPPGCEDRRARWARIAGRFRPDVIMYYLAYGGSSGRARLHGRWVTDCDPAYDQYLEAQLGEEVADLSRTAPVALVTTPYAMAFTPEEATANARLVDCRNRVYRRVVTDHPEVALVDLNHYVTTMEHAGLKLRRDLVHFSVEGGALAGVWLLPQLQAIAGRTASVPPPLLSL